MGNGTNRNVALGCAFVIASYGLYALHYGTMKWLGSDYSLWQLIFMRSAVMFGLTLAISGRTAVREALATAYKLPIAFRATLQLASMLCFYSAASMTSLAKVMTLYSTAPVMIVILSVIALREKVGAFRWLAVAVGLAGTIIAANPGAGMDILPSLLALGSALTWALTVVFTRSSGTRDSSAVQLLIAGALYLVISGSLMTWHAPDSIAPWAILLVSGAQIYLAQFLFFEACRRAPASLIGPLEYTSLIWTTALGFILFSEIPTLSTIAGALLVAGSGIALAAGLRDKAGTIPVGQEAPEMAPMIAEAGDELTVSEDKPLAD